MADIPCFNEPADENTKIYRYINFSSFMDFLMKERLFFPSAKKLSEIDPYESRVPKKHIKDSDKTILKLLRGNIFISCWHMNKIESDAMWKIYSRNDDGIAIQSTYSKLKKCLLYPEGNLYFSKMKYINYETYKKRNYHQFLPFILKNKCFTHEKELRVIAFRREWIFQEELKFTNLSIFKKELTDFIKDLNSDKAEKDIMGRIFDLRKSLEDISCSDTNQPPNIEEILKIIFPSTGEPDGDGIYLDVRPETLIESIYISPGAKEWFYNLVKRMLEEHGLEKIEVHKSILAKNSTDSIRYSYI